MTTEAGRRLHDELLLDSLPMDRVSALIAAIEAEARRAALTSLRERVEGMERWPCTAVDYEYVVEQAAVLAEIDRALGDG